MKQMRSWVVRSLVLAAAHTLSLVSIAQAITINDYAIPTPLSRPFQIVAGPDGNLWFTEFTGAKIGRITPGGVITEFPLPNPLSNAGEIVAGPDGNLWFTESIPIRISRIARITPNGVITEFDLPNPSETPYSLIAGKDGNLWYAVAGRKIGKISPSGVVTEYPLPVGELNQFGQITTDPEGNIVFVQTRSQPPPAPAEYFLGKLTPNGAFTETSLGKADLYLITDLGLGPDGQLWYSTFGLPDSSLNIREDENGFRSLPSVGPAMFIPTRSLAPNKFIIGPDNSFWFFANTGAATNRIGRATLNGMVTVYETGGMPRFNDLTSGPDGGIWLVDPSRNVISKLTPDGANDAVMTRASSFVSGAMAADSIAALFSRSLSAATESAGALPLPTTLAGVSVKVRDRSGAERAAPLFFVSPSQINFLVPSGTQTGNASVAVTGSGEQVISTGTMMVDAVAPGLFSADATGQGLAAGAVLRVKPDGSQNYEPIVQRDANGNLAPVPIDLGPEGDQVFLVLFGSGVRGNSGLSSVIALSRGGLLPVVYAGAQGNYVGLDQINLLLPRAFTGRGEQEVMLSVAGKVTNRVKFTLR